mmetsp:Transcript_88161/g.284661  ORF Transcript_88161/g.284661 Transcript_88161/m.284661 type:complete len:272 (+) Transcript_88161:1639-2454(+)
MPCVSKILSFALQSLCSLCCSSLDPSLEQNVKFGSRLSSGAMASLLWLSASKEKRASSALGLRAQASLASPLFALGLRAKAPLPSPMGLRANASLLVPLRAKGSLLFSSASPCSALSSVKENKASSEPIAAEAETTRAAATPSNVAGTPLPAALPAAVVVPAATAPVVAPASFSIARAPTTADAPATMLEEVAAAAAPVAALSSFAGASAPAPAPTAATGATPRTARGAAWFSKEEPASAASGSSALLRGASVSSWRRLCPRSSAAATSPS